MQQCREYLGRRQSKDVAFALCMFGILDASNAANVRTCGSLYLRLILNKDILTAGTDIPRKGYSELPGIVGSTLDTSRRKLQF